MTTLIGKGLKPNPRILPNEGAAMRNKWDKYQTGNL
jgi:hypothetical protein